MPAMISASPLYGWTYGGSIFTFAFPMILFIGVVTALWVLLTKPHLVPGHRYHMNGRAVTSTSSVKVNGQDGAEDGHAAPGQGTEAK